MQETIDKLVQLGWTEVKTVQRVNGESRWQGTGVMFINDSAQELHALATVKQFKLHEVHTRAWQLVFVEGTNTRRSFVIDRDFDPVAMTVECKLSGDGDLFAGLCQKANELWGDNWCEN